MSLELAIGLVASGVFLARLLPQPLRLLRSGVPDGVSPLSAINGVVNAVAWTVYGVLVGLPIVWFPSAVAIVLSAWTAWMLRRSSRVLDHIGGMAWLSVVVGAGALGHLGLVLAGSVALTMGPQVVMSIRRSDLSGIAPAAMWIGLVDAATWGGYGLAVGDAPLLSYALVLSSSCGVILWRIALTSRRVAIPQLVGGDLEPSLAPAPL